MKAASTFQWRRYSMFAVSYMLLCSTLAFAVNGHGPSCSVGTVEIVEWLHLLARCSFIFKAKSEFHFNKEILNSNSCMFTTSGDFINTRNLQMYAVRLNTDETSIDCLQQANVLTRPRFDESEDRLSKTGCLAGSQLEGYRLVPSALCRRHSCMMEQFECYEIVSLSSPLLIGRFCPLWIKNCSEISSSC